jgi:hypothetical protein
MKFFVQKANNLIVHGKNLTPMRGTSKVSITKLYAKLQTPVI